MQHTQRDGQRFSLLRQQPRVGYRVCQRLEVAGDEIGPLEARRRILEDGTGSPEQGKSFDGTLSIDEVCAAFDAAWEAGSARGLLELLETEEVLYESIWEVNRTNNQVRLWRATGDRRGA